jgi:hypothetical protein
MKFLKITDGYGPEPNLAEPSISFDGSDLILTFPLNWQIFKNFHQGDTGKLTFKNWYKYRMGDPNDEGFYGRDNETKWSRAAFPELEFNEFYEVLDSDWQNDFGPSEQINQHAEQGTADKKHYLCFMKDGTFEVVADSYNQQIPA